MKKFIWNHNDVCENPNTMSYKCIQKNILTISTAQAPNGKWDYGLQFQKCMGYLTFGCLIQLARFDNENECFEYALKEAIEAMEKSKCIDMHRRLLEMIRAEIKIISTPAQPTFVQLSMF